MLSRWMSLVKFALKMLSELSLIISTAASIILDPEEKCRKKKKKEHDHRDKCCQITCAFGEIGRLCWNFLRFIFTSNMSDLHGFKGIVQHFQ